MAGLLISGPAGAGKSAAGREVLAEQGQAVLVEFQPLYAALLGIERVGSRYPERLPADAYIMPTVEYTRRAIITAALSRQLFVVLTNSDGDPTRRQELLGFLGPGSNERVIDPGREIVEDRLSVNGQLSQNCRQAVDRWYLRRNQ